MSSYRRPESVLVLVYTQDQQVLLIERADRPGYWQSVTGGMEEGETALECARRELYEETGLQLEPVPTGITNTFEILPHWRYRYDPQVKENTEYVFFVELELVVEPKLDPEEHTGYVWLDPQAAMQKCFSYTNANAIEQIILQTRDPSE